MANIVLIHPTSETSYWGWELALPMFGKKATFAPAALTLLAALTPPEHTVTVVDENVEPIDFDALARADIVGITGMTVHRTRMREILAEFKRRGTFTVVGGPWVTVREDYFGDLADVIFVGEAEETWPQFLREWQDGRHARRYEQAEKTDMTTVPVPRYDLIKSRDYMFGSMQFSRGCPFQCEFCDIIVTFGRRPRLKTSAQVIAELEALKAQGVNVTFIVDDNLIGNKRAIKPILRDLAAWQRENRYHMTFFTEASLDLAEDPELMRLMVEAKIIGVFVGIETPNEAALKETKKYQNVRKGGTIIDRVHAIQDAGLEVWCGMIMGFDNDDPSIFDAQVEFLRQSQIPNALLGMLFAIPKTPLHERLRREGRLDPDDFPRYGTNVMPQRMTRQQLADGFVRVMREVYEPSAYFGRLDDLFLKRRIPYLSAAQKYWRENPWEGFKVKTKEITMAGGLFARLMMRVKDAKLRREYRTRLGRVLRQRPDPFVLFMYTMKCALHYHHWMMANRLASKEMDLAKSY